MHLKIRYGLNQNSSADALKCLVKIDGCSYQTVLPYCDCRQHTYFRIRVEISGRMSASVLLSLIPKIDLEITLRTINDVIWKDS